MKPRPAILRALGALEPPELVTVAGEPFYRQDIFKHDSWAATGLYQGRELGIVCKFNRSQRVFLLPMRWLGRFLARREMFAYHQLAGIAGIIESCGPVYVEGQVWSNIAAHRYVPGHPLGKQEKVPDDFFPALLKTLQEIHRRGFAYVDLHKRENILVGEDGIPYLIDFQISFYASPDSLFWPVTKPLLHLLQKSDLYHLSKHVKRLRPEQLCSLGLVEISQPPWWIRAHRRIAVPFRQFRRWLLTLLRVRGKSGHSNTEVFAEHAFRCEQEKAA